MKHKISDNEKRCLIEYCSIYNLDMHDFEFSECPDLQSTKLNIGVEHTSTKTKGEHKAWSTCGCYTRAVHTVDDIPNLIITIQDKTNKLNGLYKKFATNVLFLEASEMCGVLGGSNPFLMCDDVVVCDVSKCKKIDNSNECCEQENCGKTIRDEKIQTEFLLLDCNDCTRIICAIGAIVKAIKNADFGEGLKFNPIIITRNISCTGEFYAFIVNTDNFTFSQHKCLRIVGDVEKAKEKFNGEKCLNGGTTE